MLEKSEGMVSGAPIRRLSCGSVRVSSALGALGVDLSLRAVGFEFLAARYRGIMGDYACCVLIFKVREVFWINGTGAWDGRLGGCGIG